MKIGLVWPAANRLTDITIRYERYVRGFERLGHNVVTVCTEESAEGYCPSVRSVPDLVALRDPGFWSRLELDVAVVITWLCMPELLSAIRAGGPRVVSIGESDGVVGTRIWPFTILRRMLAFHSRWRMKAGAAKHWALLAAGGYRTAEQPLLASADQADLITMTSPGARANLARFFEYHRRTDLAKKVAVVPYPVDDEFLNGTVPSEAERQERVVAIGRWDDPQKDAPLLAAGIEWAAARLPNAEFVLVGRNGQAAFSRLCRRVPRVRCVGILPSAAVAELLRASRCMVLSSRWESGPIAAFEALALGVTVVGPSWVPACTWFNADGPYGQLFEHRSGASLGAALVDELTAWRAGKHNPLATAARWRPRVDPANVCQAFLNHGCPIC